MTQLLLTFHEELMLFTDCVTKLLRIDSVLTIFRVNSKLFLLKIIQLTKPNPKRYKLVEQLLLLMIVER